MVQRLKNVYHLKRFITVDMSDECLQVESRQLDHIKVWIVGVPMETSQTAHKEEAHFVCAARVETKSQTETVPPLFSPLTTNTRQHSVRVGILATGHSCIS